jgi:hypothetical protein
MARSWLRVVTPVGSRLGRSCSRYEIPGPCFIGIIAYFQLWYAVIPALSKRAVFDAVDFDVSTGRIPYGMVRDEPRVTIAEEKTVKHQTLRQAFHSVKGSRWSPKLEGVMKPRSKTVAMIFSA